MFSCRYFLADSCRLLLAVLCHSWMCLWLLKWNALMCRRGTLDQLSSSFSALSSSPQRSTSGASRGRVRCSRCLTVCSQRRRASSSYTRVTTTTPSIGFIVVTQLRSSFSALSSSPRRSTSARPSTAGVPPTSPVITNRYHLYTAVWMWVLFPAHRYHHYYCCSCCDRYICNKRSYKSKKSF